VRRDHERELTPLRVISSHTFTSSTRSFSTTHVGVVGQLGEEMRLGLKCQTTLLDGAFVSEVTGKRMAWALMAAGISCVTRRLYWPAPNWIDRNSPIAGKRNKAPFSVPVEYGAVSALGLELDD